MRFFYIVPFLHTSKIFRTDSGFVSDTNDYKYLKSCFAVGQRQCESSFAVPSASMVEL